MPVGGADSANEPAAPVGFAELLHEPVEPTPQESAEQGDDATTPLAEVPRGFVWNLTSRQSAEHDDATQEATAPQAATAEDATPPVRRTNFLEPHRAPAPPVPVPSTESTAAPETLTEAPPAPTSPEPPGETSAAAAASAASASPAPTAPAAPTQGFEPPSFVAALSMPRPPEWGDAPASPAEPAAPSDSVSPTNESQGDAPSSIQEIKPPTNETAPLQGHGLAALLGGHQEEPPASRPLLGDTTGIIPLLPTYTPPPATPAATADEVAASAPVAAAPDAAGAGAGAVGPPPLIEPAAPERIRPPDTAPFGGAAQTEAILGAPPSPATSPFDAEALAVASAERPTAAIPVDGTSTSMTPVPEPLRERETPQLADEHPAAEAAPADDEQEAGEESDGISALFGDFALDGDAAADADDRADDLANGGDTRTVDTTQHSAQGEAASTDVAAPIDGAAPADPTAAAHGGAFGIDAILFPELVDDPRATPEAGAAVADAAFLEPTAAMEGPQRVAGSDSDLETGAFDPTATPTVAFDAAAAAREPLTPTVSTPTTAASTAAASTVPSPTAAGQPAADFAASAQPAPPTLSPGAIPPKPPEPPSGPRDPRFNRRVYLIAGLLAVLLVLVGLFALGTRIPSLFGASAPSQPASASRTPSATPTPTPTPTPTVIPKPAAAVGPGEHAWDTLGGGECIQPYTSPWAETFTVVDCAADHSAQMVYTNLLSADPAAPYPGADALAQQINALCTAGGVIDLNAAATYPDLQVQGTFPATEEQWKSGQRSYYCFASRSSGQPLSTSVQGQGPTT